MSRSGCRRGKGRRGFTGGQSSCWLGRGGVPAPVIKIMRARGCLEDECAACFRPGGYSGCPVHHVIRVDSCDKVDVERLCRHLVHPLIVVGRLWYDGSRVASAGPTIVRRTDK
jgi:hypothetical protein